MWAMLDAMSDNTSESPGTAGPPPRRTRRTASIGRSGEDLAVEHVERLGWVVRDRNWRNRYGELDLVAVDGSALVIVEVKKRASRVFGDPAAAVTRQKLSRMRKLAGMWLAENGHGWTAIRFDIISVQLDPRDPEGIEPVVRHHRGIHE